MTDITFPSGIRVPALGIGTWMMGEDPALKAAEIAALRKGVELGMTVIDTAEIYGDGLTETLVGEALSDLRQKIFLVSKVHPSRAGRDSAARACEASLRRLKTDYLDLYLLHWPGGIPLAQTVEAMEKLCQSGKIRHWGVSNFDVADMQELSAAGGNSCATNQILYNLSRRGPEFDLLPYLDQHKIPVMAYSPIEQARLLTKRSVRQVAERHGATPAQVALAWLLAKPGILPIPKAGTAEHIEENFKAAAIKLTPDDEALLASEFPAPTRKLALAML